MADLSYLDAVILGIVEGLTEYLPVSSTGHLTIAEKLLGLEVDDPAVTAYTAVIQLGAIAATLIYFFKDIVRFALAWFRGLGGPRGAGIPTTGWPGPSSSARSRSASSASSLATSSRARCAACGWWPSPWCSGASSWSSLSGCTRPSSARAGSAGSTPCARSTDSSSAWSSASR